MAALCDGLLDTVGIRGEIDRREAQGFWVAGAGGIGGAFPMHVRKAKSGRAAAAKAAASLKNAVRGMLSEAQSAPHLQAVQVECPCIAAMHRAWRWCAAGRLTMIIALTRSIAAGHGLSNDLDRTVNDSTMS